MAKDKTKKVEADTTETSSGVTGTVPVDSQEKAVERPVKHKYANQRTVTLSDGSERVYTPFTHGAVWEALANNYAAANPGSTIE